MSIQNAVHHFETITKHKWLVMKHCFAVGLIRQGLLHDLSKYSWEEFSTGVLYYQGNRSPNAAEKDARGYSSAWLHHKGRNKHHTEFWIDYIPISGKPGTWRLDGHKMPLPYLIEMVMDRIAASKVYKGEAYTDASPWEYNNMSRNVPGVHPETARQLDFLLSMLREKGEKKTFSYIRALLWRDKMRRLCRWKKAFSLKEGRKE